MKFFKIISALLAMIFVLVMATGVDFWKNLFFMEIDLENLHHLFPEILSRNVADRLAMKGMLPLRVDMMVVVCIFIELILKKLNIQTVHLSDFAMKEGMMDELDGLTDDQLVQEITAAIISLPPILRQRLESDIGNLGNVISINKKEV